MFTPPHHTPSHTSHCLYMEEEIKLLLAENARLLAENAKASDSLQIIPVIIRHGTFTPSRLEKWPFHELSREIETSLQYRTSFIHSLIHLVSQSTSTDTNSTISFTLNEKKAVSILLASKGHFKPVLLPILKELAISAPRTLLAHMEYVDFPVDYETLSSQCSLFHLKANTATSSRFSASMVPKLAAKYPLLLEMLEKPSIEQPKRALQLLIENSGSESENRVILECAARCLDSYQLYTEILTPIWGIKREPAAVLVLSALSHCKELESFCLKCIEELKN